MELELELLLDNQIQDKAKQMDRKRLVCVQVIWFCPNSKHYEDFSKLADQSARIERYGTYSACALLIYLMWWHKPLNVSEPPSVKGYKVRRYLHICG